MAKRYTVTTTARLGNAVTRSLARLGVPRLVEITTTGSRSGRPRSVPVAPIEVDGRRYLVAPYGPVAWVGNVRADPSVTVRSGRRVERLLAVEADSAEAARVLRAYVRRERFVRRYLDVGPDDPVEVYEAVVADHPVFRLTVPAAT